MDGDTRIGSRVGEVRKVLGLTRQRFADDLSINHVHAASMENNNRKVPERIIKMICFTYGVNENWLRTGKENMFKNGRDLKLEEIVGSFKRLGEPLQDYVLKQIRLAMEFQEKINSGR